MVVDNDIHTAVYVVVMLLVTGPELTRLTTSRPSWMQTTRETAAVPSNGSELTIRSNPNNEQGQTATVALRRLRHPAAAFKCSSKCVKQI